MDNPEEVMQILERFNVTRNPEITAQLEEYITFVARTGDSVYAWSLVKNLFREKLVNVITDFHNETPTKGEKVNHYNNIQQLILCFISRTAAVPKRGSLQLRHNEKDAAREARFFRRSPIHNSTYQRAPVRSAQTVFPNR